MITWDEGKRKQVINEHGVGFEKIEDIFDDLQAVYFEDHGHSTDDEIRFNVIGLAASYGLAVATYIYIENDTGIRFITARRARKDGW